MDSVCQASSCADGIQNGAEAGVDCGGECGLCPDEFAPCNCAQSETLRAVSCGFETAHWFHATPAGDTIVYSVNSHTYLWTPSDGLDLLMRQADVIAISDDAGTALMGSRAEGDLVVWYRDGTRDVFDLMTAVALSADGQVVLAWEYSSTPRSVLIRREQGVVDIVPAAMEAEGVYYRMEKMARDGSAVVGVREAWSHPEVSLGYIYEPVLWRQAEGARVLGPLPAGAASANADAVSSGGLVVTGTLIDAQNNPLGVYRHTALDGLTQIIPSSADWARTLLSDDGNTVISVQDDRAAALTTAVRWTPDSGVERLISSDGRSTLPVALTPDGRTIIGELFPYGRAGGSPAEGVSPFVWRSDLGLVDIASALAATGIDLQGWQLGTPGAVSADGRVIVGNADCGGVPSAYRLELPW